MTTSRAVPGFVALVGLAVAGPADARAQARVGTPDAGNPLGFLEPLMGEWLVDADSSVFAANPGLAGRVIQRYESTVGGRAVALREGYAQGSPEESELVGLVHFDPTTGLVEFVAVAGHDEGEGRLFRGEYVPLDDGRIQRIYDVFYRTAADTPGEELGGLRRRYREIYSVDGDRIEATLDWWRDGCWQPFGPGTFALRRAASRSVPR